MRSTRLRLLLGALFAFLASGCTPAERAPAASPDSASTAVASAPSGPAPFAVPHDSLIPNDLLGASIRRGRALFAATRDSLPANVGGNLRCASCHLDDGKRANAAPLIGVYARFPQFRTRTGSVVMIEDRVNDCFQRSMNGRAIAWQSPEMRDIVAYLAFLSRGIAAPGVVQGLGLPKLAALQPDTARGAQVYTASCARCHGADGAGAAAVPAVWGPKSFNIAASMARQGTAAGFIRTNMPFDVPGTLTEQQAHDVAAYINSHSRPDFKGKENDWPNGDAPSDVPYVTRGANRK